MRLFIFTLYELSADIVWSI